MHILTAAGAAGMVAILVTVAIERLGGRRGGLLGTLPTTIVPAAIGFWWSAASLDDFQNALRVVPAGMMLNAVFLWFWRAFPARLPPWRLHARLGSMVVLSMSAWVVLALILLSVTETYRSAELPMTLLGWGFFGLAVLLGITACLRGIPAPAGKHRVGLFTIVGRGALAALAIGLAVALAEVSSPIIAGLVSIFPAIFLTTVVALWISQEEAVPTGAVGPMMLGSTSVSAFALLAAHTLPRFGAAPGTIIAWAGAVLLVTVPAWMLLERLSRSRRQRRGESLSAKSSPDAL